MKHLLFFLFCIIAFFTATSQNSLTVANPHFNVNYKTQGIITEPTIEVTPAGAYAQVEFTFKINAQSSSYSSKDSLEAVLKFDLPNNSYIHDSWLWLDANTIIRADIIEKNRAIQIYEGIVKRRRDPSLLLKTGNNSYQLSVYPLTTTYPRKIKITYSVPFNWTNNKVTVPMPFDILGTSFTLPDVAMNINYNNAYANPSLSEKNINNFVLSNSGTQYSLLINNGNYSAADATTLCYNVNLGGKPLLSTHPVNATESVYQLVIPSDAITTNKRNTVFIIDHFVPNSIYTLQQIKNYLKTTLLNDYNSTDSFNVFYADGNSIINAFPTWHSTDSASVINCINNIPGSYTNNGTQYESLLKMALSFCQTKAGANAQVVILSNNTNYSTNQTTVDALFNNVKNYIGSFTNKVNVINYSTSNYNTSAGYLRGNELLYSKLCLASNGTHYKYQNATYVYVGSKYIYFYDLNAPNCLRELATNCGVQTSAYSINIGTTGGFTYSKFTLNGLNKLSLNTPYVETGKFTGSILPGSTVQIQAITGSGMINNSYTLSSVQTGNDLHIKAWTHRYIEDLIKSNNSSLVKEIIDSSIHNRVLCTSTAFLAVETGDTISTNTNDNPNVSVGGINVHTSFATSNLKCYPNPFTDALTLEFDTEVEKIDVFDMTGRKVFTAILNKNEKKFVWNGKDNTGASLSPGVYIITAQTATDRISLKVHKQ